MRNDGGARFYAVFAGDTERHNGVLVRNGDVYRVERIRCGSGGGLEWFRVRPVDCASLSRIGRIMSGLMGDRWLGMGAATEIPYGSLEAFGENWKVLYDGEGRLVEW